MNHYDYDLSSLKPGRQQASPPGLLVKLLALGLLLLCLAVGMVGLILPIIPGLLFLAIAALIAARLVPALDRRLRRNAMMAPYLDKADQFTRLSLQGKAKFVLWLTMKVVFDTFVVMLRCIAAVVAWFRADRPRTRS